MIKFLRICGCCLGVASVLSLFFLGDLEHAGLGLVTSIAIMNVVDIEELKGGK